MTKMEVDPNNMSDQESIRIRRIVGWSIIGLIAVIGLSIALSLYFAPRPGGGFFHHPFFFPIHFGWLGVILLIFLVFLVARWLFFWPWGEREREERYYSHQHQQRPDAASIVKERYAKGEITREQFEQMMRDLRQQEGG
jgi:putative membrane protein